MPIGIPVSVGLAVMLFLMAAGCQLPRRQQIVRLPVRHSVESEQLLVLSDVPLDRTHPLIVDLVQLREQVAETLQLPMNERRVVVYLFGSELQYRQYLETAYPGLPPRRAYFVGTPDELAVYTFWGERIQEDLRHEFTHGLLHASLKAVPLWLDEGLAEYFEVVSDAPGRVNVDYAGRLVTAATNGWQPDMRRLEQMEQVSQMQRVDYQEAWAWAHFLLHSSADTRSILLSYLQELRTSSSPGPLSGYLGGGSSQMNARLVSYVSSLNTFGSAVYRTEPSHDPERPGRVMLTDGGAGEHTSMGAQDAPGAALSTAASAGDDTEPFLLPTE